MTGRGRVVTAGGGGRGGHDARQRELVSCMLRLLDAFTHHVATRDLLVLKGGTAIHLFGGPPARLSQDIDMNLLEPESPERGAWASIDLSAAFAEIAGMVGASYAARRKRSHALSIHVSSSWDGTAGSCL